MNRTEKKDSIAAMTESIGTVTDAFVIDFQGISVPQVTELRKQLRESNSQYVVVKNTLALIAIKGKPLEALNEQFSGPTAIAWSEDPVGLAKLLTKFAKDTPALKFKGALLDGEAIPVEKIDQIASLPSRDELIAKLAYLLNSPIQGLVNVLNANIRNLAVVLDQISKQKSDATAE